jgi:hypothetical protein
MPWTGCRHCERVRIIDCNNASRCRYPSAVVLVSIVISSMEADWLPSPVILIRDQPLLGMGHRRIRNRQREAGRTGRGKKTDEDDVKTECMLVTSGIDRGGHYYALVRIFVVVVVVAFVIYGDLPPGPTSP